MFCYVKVCILTKVIYLYTCKYLKLVWSLFYYIVVKYGLWLSYLKVETLLILNLNMKHFVPNRIQVIYSKYVLGVHKSATNIAILGELGLYPLSLNALKSSVRYWLHILNVNDNNLIFHSYKDNLLIKDGLFIKLKSFF